MSKEKEYDSLKEEVNTLLNVNALILALNRKGLITADEFTLAKEQALADLKKEFPNMFV